MYTGTICTLLSAALASGTETGPYDLSKEELYGQQEIFNLRAERYHPYTEKSQSIIANFNGDEHIFVVYLTDKRKPKVLHIREGYETVDENVGESWYAAFDNQNHHFSIGVDEEGYIHVAGDMNGYPFWPNDGGEPKYQRYHVDQYCMIWKSKAPLDVTAFEFVGDKKETSLAGTGFWNVKFINDLEKRLYATYRVVTDPDEKKTGWGASWYDTKTKTWVGINGGLPDGESFSAVVTKDGEGLGGDRNVYGDMGFDRDNKMHISVGALTEAVGEESRPEGMSLFMDSVGYASSENGGETLERSDGSSCVAPLHLDKECNGHHMETVKKRKYLEAYVCVRGTVFDRPLVMVAAPGADGRVDGSTYFCSPEKNHDSCSSEGWKCYESDKIKNAYERWMVSDALGVITIIDGKKLLRMWDADEMHEIEIGHGRIHPCQQYTYETGNFLSVTFSSEQSEGMSVIRTVLSRPMQYPMTGKALSFDRSN
ncbi:MAG: uncharacterized protein A8A55_2219 [Amphiamblys sp. WSBS2006]|nr:MAG: uncharacterized protein A8A55_2219 [Amphiamblys sp. WSBS2006]